MADPRTPPSADPSDPLASLDEVRELRNQLTRAYLSGDGATVEHVMEQLAAAERRAQTAA